MFDTYPFSNLNYANFKKMRKLLIGGLFAGIGYGLYKIASNAGQLQYGSLKLQKTSYQPLTTFVFHLLFPITNPTKTVFPFKGIEGAVWYGKTKLANIQLDTTETIVLKTGKTVNVPIKVVIDVLELSGDLQKLVRSGEFLNAAWVKGTIKSDLNFPFEVKIY